MSEQGESNEIKQLALAAASNEKVVETVVGVLETGSRRERQKAARVIAVVAETNPVILLPHVEILVAALDKPEAQTRWEALGVLWKLVDLDSSICEAALLGAEAALFDEGSGLVRLAGMRFMCKAGSLSEERSKKVWPLVDEAIQCYHGDHEFSEMLNALVEFSAGNLADEVKDQLAARMKFDAENGRGSLKRRASLIMGNISN